MPERKLLAIMFTDVVGFSTSMSNDERVGIEILQKNRSILKPAVEKYHGVFLKEIGDGTLSSFPSAIEAVLCALENQEALKSETGFSIRIGIHLGDVIIDSNDVFGDGVNIASRIESQARPGCVCVSRQVYDQIRNKSFISAESLGEKELKGITGKIDLYSIARDAKNKEYEKLIEEIIPEKFPKSKDTKHIILKKRQIPLVVGICIIVIGVGLYFGISIVDSKRTGITRAKLGNISPATVSAVLSGRKPNYKPKSNEELYGIWISDKADYREIVYSSDSWNAFLHVSDQKPIRYGKVQIDSKWKDSNGNIYYGIVITEFDSLTSADVEGKMTELAKLNASSTMLEVVMHEPTNDVELATLPIPSSINPSDPYYAIYYRANK